MSKQGLHASDRTAALLVILSLFQRAATDCFHGNYGNYGNYGTFETSRERFTSFT
ncbi:hypothetical protein BFJ70_g17181 [Fusarium oxysporum]|jgi:hypothetical protein|nr:hypothetical protein BFJ70_g17181 [Fusarium oxysporum]